jgi:hypothetical protein
MIKNFFVFLIFTIVHIQAVYALNVMIFQENTDKKTDSKSTCSQSRQCAVKDSTGHMQQSKNYVKKLRQLYKTDLYESFSAVLSNRGFPPTAIPRLFCVAYLESGFKMNAKNTNKNGTTDVGLFQINSVWLDQCGDPGRSLEANLDCAKVVLDHQGLNAWVTYKEQGWVCEQAITG